MAKRVADFIRKRARRLRRDSTDAERALWRLLRSRPLKDVKFRRQTPVGPWVVDFVAFEQRLVVEADGSQHLDSKRDLARDADLQARGFLVLRFWNNDILHNTEGVLHRIVETIGTLPSPRGLRPRPSPTRGEGERRGLS